MPGADFFRRLGLFVVERFFDDESCAQFRSEIDAVPCEKALVVQKGEELLNESVRRVKVAAVSKSTRSLVRSRLRELKTDIEQHFRVSLEDCESPQFLAYQEGCFFRAHEDSNSHPDAATFLKSRSISLVLFLNGESQDPAEGCFGGGRLTLYGLLEGPNWKNCPLPVRAETGLLVAFRSDLLHEVKPVAFGRRYTVVSWFYSGEIT